MSKRACPSGSRVVRGIALAASTACAVVLGVPGVARAEPATGRPSPDPQSGVLHPVTHDDDSQDEFAAFPLVVPHDKHWVRASVELDGVVAVGFVQYLLKTAAVGGLVRAGDKRWALRYDWPELRGKLVGTAYELDTNAFSTNYVWHPFAGTAYFTVARSNHLSFAESVLLGFAGSSVWEYFGEIRERVSVNDMLVTPLAGAAIGESMMQLSDFFNRGRPGFQNRVLSFITSPIKQVNNWSDSDGPRRAPEGETDALGFPLEPWHRFEASVGGGMTVQGTSAGPPGRAPAPRATYADVRFGLDLAIVNLPGYRGVARHARLFDDGNVSSIRLSGAVSDGRVVDTQFGVRVLPVGYYWRDAELDARGQLWGHGAVLGLRMAYEYGVHAFDREGRRPNDLVSIVSPLGIAAEHTFHAGGVRLRSSLDVFGAIAGIVPYALSDYQAVRETTDGLPTAVRTVGYYHAFAIGMMPSLELRWHDVVLDGRARLDSFRPIQGLDPNNASVDRRIGISDQRFAAKASLAWEPAVVPLRFAVGAERATRFGEVGATSARRNEVSLSGSVGVLF